MEHHACSSRTVRPFTRNNLDCARCQAGDRGAGRELVEEAVREFEPLGDRAAEDLAAARDWLESH